MFSRGSLITLICLLAWVTGCRRADPPSTPSNPNPTATPPSAMIEGSATVGAEFLPTAGEVAGYVGSASCRECHPDQHASWHQSFHRTMTQWPTPEAIQADFNHVVLTNNLTRYILSRQDSAFWVRMESAASPEQGRSIPEPVDVPLGLVTGSHHMQVFWIGNGSGNTQIGFPFTWLIPEKRWVPRNSTFLRPPSVPLRPEVWNIICSRCHATGAEPHMDRENRAFHTRIAEPGISCEACHGPGESHVTLTRTLPKTPRGTFPIPREPTASREPTALRDLAIIHPEKIDPQRSSQICGFCHSMKWFDHNTRWSESGFAYRPGDDLEKTTPIIRATATNSPPALLEYLERNPTLLADFFWSDGMVRVSGREYNGLIESPCYGKPKSGKSFACISCHSLHDSEPDDQLARNRTGNRACLQCHEHFRESPTLTAHTHHRDGSSGSECANCHMPHTTYGVLKAIRSHQISNPDVRTEVETGRPNACNLCHLDKSLSWTAAQLATWYARRTPKIPPENLTIADSLRLGLSGDAGQRVLIAWHLGWTNAVQVSGGAGFALLLEQLLHDPYAAVRCVAERSARSLGFILDPNYDFTKEPSTQPALKEPLSAFEHSEFLRLAANGGESGPSVQFTLAKWLAQRNTRDVRLRE